MRRAILLPFITCLIVLTPSRNSTQAQYRFDSWTTDSGLPQNSVYAMTQTRDGYLWFTTLDGLVRFDGVRFTVFDQSNTKGLASNRFTALYEDAAGTLWIGTEDGRLTCYKDGAFTTFNVKEGLTLNEIFEIQPDGDGGLLLTMQAGTARWRAGKLLPNSNNVLFEPRRIYWGPSGSRWIFDQAGLHQLLNGKETTYAVPLDTARWLGCNIYESPSGTVWLTQNRTGIFRLKNGEVTRYTEKDGLPKIEEFSRMLEDGQGNTWFTTGVTGLLRFRDGRFTSYTAADGLSSNNLRALLQDREGTLWIGTFDRGLNRLTRQVITAFSSKDGLPADTVYPIYQDRAGAIWIGTVSGLSRFNNGAFINYKVGDIRKLNDIQALGEDHEGRLWFGNYGSIGWFKNDAFTFSAAFGDRGLRAVSEDSRGALWFATEQGVVRLKDQVVTTYDLAAGLPSLDVKVIHEDRQGNLWFGTYGGLARFQDGRISSFTTSDGLGSNRVRSIYEDREGTLWIGTYDGGLSRYQAGRFTTYNINVGLFNNGAFQILEDAHGNLWISCNRGIYRVSKQQLNDFADGKIAAITCIAYGKLDGMLNTECNGGRQPAGIKANDGRLWFPTLGGVVVIDPEAVPFNSQPPPVLIEGVTLDRNSVPFKAGVRVAPGQANLEINFTGLSYVKPEQVRFKYQLVGQDHDWIDAGTRRSANYSYLPAGQYTFRVIAANSDGVWNDTGATIKINVVPRFYRTWWFLSLIIMLIAGLAISIYRWRIWQLQRRNALQENFSRQLIQSQEGERKRIAAELHDSIGQSLLIIKNRAFLGLNGSDQTFAAREQLQEISGSVTDALEEVRAIAYHLRPSQLERLGLTSTLEEMLERVAATSEIDFSYQIAPLEGAFTPEMEINFYRVVQESINNIIKHSQATEARVNITSSAQAIELIIADNGQGFVPDATSVRGTRGFGLTGIAERVRMLGGSLHIDSTQGTSIKITLNTAV